MKHAKRDHQGCQKYFKVSKFHSTWHPLWKYAKQARRVRISLRNETLFCWPINSPLFVEPVASLLPSRESTTCPYSEPNKSIPASHHHIHWFILILYSNILPCFHKVSFLPIFQHFYKIQPIICTFSCCCSQWDRHSNFQISCQFSVVWVVPKKPPSSRQSLCLIKHYNIRPKGRVEL